jgi:hypothetical protein
MSTQGTEKRNGKRPIAEKSAAGFGDLDFGNNMRLSPEILNEIKEQHLAHRFVDARQLEKYGNTHKNGWVPYKVKAREATNDIQAMQLGVSPDGFVRRGTLVLAVRSEQIDAQHRAMIVKRNAVQQEVQAQQAGALREMARAAGLKKDIVSEGYDEEDDKA